MNGEKEQKVCLNNARNVRGMIIIRKKGDKMPKGVYKRKPLTEEHKRKLSEANFGKHQTEETKRKISEGHKGQSTWIKGKHLSDITKKKLSDINKGKHYTEESKKKMSESHKGQISWNKGKPFLQIRGKNHFNWKGGVSFTIMGIRRSEKYLKWRSDIFIRDNFTCQKCGDNTGGNLEAHHKKPFSKLIDEVRKNLPLLPIYEAAMLYTPFWDINNGITLCKKCHKSIKKISKEAR